MEDHINSLFGENRERADQSRRKIQHLRSRAVPILLETLDCVGS